MFEETVEQQNIPVEGTEQFVEPEMDLEEASPEEEELLNATMDSIEEIIHGQMRDKIVTALDSTPELYQSISTTAANILERVSHKMDEQQIPNDGGIFFGVNGAIQQTVELLWEVAEAMGHPATKDEDNLPAAYLATLGIIGEHMMEDEESAREAQAFLIDLEMGDNATEMAADELEMMNAEPDVGGGGEMYTHAPRHARR